MNAIIEGTLLLYDDLQQGVGGVQISQIIILPFTHVSCLVSGSVL
jgi:hypothetical protein